MAEDRRQPGSWQAGRCPAYRDDGTLWGLPATHVDVQRGCYVCVEHARRLGAASRILARGTRQLS